VAVISSRRRPGTVNGLEPEEMVPPLLYIVSREADKRVALPAWSYSGSGRPVPGDGVGGRRTRDTAAIEHDLTCLPGPRGELAPARPRIPMTPRQTCPARASRRGDRGFESFSLAVRWYGAGGEEMAPSSLHLTDGVP
jgi:hypothetical protein